MIEMSMEDRIKRMELAEKSSRCDGEKDAITWWGYEPGQAECGNCGYAFPPERIEKEKSTVWCSQWRDHESKMYFCKAWLHSNDIAAGDAPEWAKPYTKERLC